MRVALVCPYSWSFPGGVQAHVSGFAEALRRRGVEVDVLAPADGPVDEPSFVPLGRTVPIPDNRSVQRVALSPASVARTARAVRRGRYNLVHVHEPMIPAACLTSIYASRAPLVGTFHMVADSPKWYRVFKPLCLHALARLDARIAVSGKARRYVEQTIPGEYAVIPNGIDTAPYAALRGERRGNTILFVGRPERRKGLPVLLDAFRRLPGEPRLVLVGVGEKDLPAGLGEEAARVEALGRVPDDERLRRLAQADVLCAPSLGRESFGIVLVEGMAAGLPVVASAIPGYADVLPRTCGRLVPPGDAEALVAALAELLADPELRSRLGRAGRAEARLYDWERVGEEILGVYERVLGRAPERPAVAEPVRA